MNVRLSAFILLSVVLGSGERLRAGEKRTWVSSDGRFSVVAELRSADGGNARLLLDDGREITVSMMRLSADDQSYVAAKFPGPQPSDMKPPADVTPAMVESAAAACRTAREAWALMRTYYAAFPPDAASQFSVDAGLTKWKQLAEAQQLRLGRKWRSQGEVTAARQKATELVASALDLMEAKNGDAARAAFIEASKVDPDWPLPSFMIGLVYAVGMRDYEQAKAHFTEAVRRDPNDPAALNNLALVEFRAGNATAAVARWSQAAEAGPTSTRLLHNVHHFLALVDARDLPEPSSGMNVLRTLQRTMKEESVVDLHGSNGWFYLPPLTGPGEQSAPPPGVDGESMFVARHGGFVVGPSHVLSFCDASTVPGDVFLSVGVSPKTPRAGRVVARDPKHGLLLIEAPGLGGSPLPLADRFPRPGADIALASIGKPTHFSDSRTVVRGTLLSAPTPESDELFLCTTPLPPGDGAAPIADATGRVIGAAIVNQRIGKPMSVAVSHAAVVDFLKEKLPQVAAPPAGAAAQRPWDDIDRDLRQALVLVEWRMEVRRDLCQVFETLKDENPLQIFGQTAMEDILCNRCRGYAAVDCPVTGCANGGVLVSVRTVTGRSSSGVESYRVDKVRTVCNYCGGRGKVRCPTCTTGRAPAPRSPNPLQLR